MYEKDQIKAGFTVGDWQVRPSHGTLSRNGKLVQPEPKVFELLMVLAEHDGEIVSKDELIERIWDNRAMSDAPLTRCVTQLRRNLEDNERPYRYVQNVARRGYRLEEKVKLLDAPPASAANDPVPPRRLGSLPALLVMAVVVVVAVLLARFIAGTPGSVEDGAPISVAVLPFENLDADDARAYRVNGFKVELLQSLASVNDLRVVNARKDFPGLSNREIAAVLDVDHVLEASVQHDGDQLKVSYYLTQAGDGFVTASGSVDGSIDSLFELQARLASEVRGKLLVEPDIQLVTGSKPQSFAAYDAYMMGLYALENRLSPGSLEAAVEHFRKTLRIEPDFAPAYLMLAKAYTLLPVYTDFDLREAENLALGTIREGAERNDSIDELTQAIRGYFFHMRKDWIASEQAYVAATSADLADASAFLWYSRMLASTGRLEDSLRLALEGASIDPTSATINSRVAMAYTWLGDNERALVYFNRANDLGAEDPTHVLANALMLFRSGDADSAFKLVNAASTIDGANGDWIVPVFAALGGQVPVADALAAVDAAVAGDGMDPQVEFVVRAMLGDTDTALAVASRLRDYGEAFEMDLLFIPEMQRVRSHDGFEGLMKDIGLRSYWTSNGCEWNGSSMVCSSS